MPGRTSPFAPARVLSLLGLAWVLGSPVGAADFPPIRPEDRALGAVPGSPDAPAVVLYRNGRLTIMGGPTSESHSSLVVEGRIKLLTEEGREHGEVVVGHSDTIRLALFEGRTVLPDGREVALPEDSVVRERVSGGKTSYRTTATFPALEPGAILDYSYELRWELITHIEPWFFQDMIPTLHSEITYYVPGHVTARPWGRETFGRRLQAREQRTSWGTELEVWMDDLPAVPDEPATLPFEDLSSRFLLLPTGVTEVGRRMRSAFDRNVIPGGRDTGIRVQRTRLLLFEDWKSACGLVDYSYREVRRRDGRVRALGRRLAREAGTEPEARARAVYSFVRDQIARLDFPGVAVAPRPEESLDDLLRDREADLAGKALMLEAMLDAAGFAPELVWAADRRFGAIDTSVANPHWFESVLVRIELGGREVFLDPSSPGHAFGYLHPDLEGMEGLVYSRTSPRLIRLPGRSYEANVRRVTLELTVDGKGRVAGSGALSFEGHHGARWFVGEPTASGRTETLTTFLEERFPGYEVSQVTVTDDLEATRLDATWNLERRREEARGDRVTLVSSRPLGPVAQQFTLTAAERLTPVLLPFPGRDEVEVAVRWADGWAPEAVPEEVGFVSNAGSFVTEVEGDHGGRRLRVRRTFETVERLFVGPNAYLAVQALYAAAAAGDALELVLVRP